MSLTIDQEFQGLIPPLTAEEYRNLEENIKADGCRDALVIWNGTIIDGHNRYKICQENNIPYKTTEMSFNDRNEAIVWMLRNQLGRRNLNDFQRNEVALKFQDLIAQQMKERQRLNGKQQSKNLKNVGSRPNEPLPIEKTERRKEMAKIAGTSEGSIQRTKKILDKGTPEQIERARKGGKGNNISAIVREIDKGKQKEAPAPEPVKVETKMCIRCRSEKPLSQFRRGRDICNPCRKEKPRERNGVDVRDVINDLYDVNKKVTWGLDEAIELFNINFNDAMEAIDFILGQYKESIMQKENNPRFIEAVDGAIGKMNEMKGRYTYAENQQEQLP